MSAAQHTRRPAGMTAAHWEALRRLPDDLRMAVLERATLRYDGCPGLTWEEADRLALEEVLGGRQRRLPGVGT
jgi:hypothetical protein